LVNRRGRQVDQRVPRRPERQLELTEAMAIVPEHALKEQDGGEASLKSSANFK
jgi:hypothetical protein